MGGPVLTAELLQGRSDRLPRGVRVGQFEIVEYVGGGGMGHVYRAEDLGLGRTVALKILSRDQAADLETSRRFRNEARSAARLNHENIVQVFYAGEDQGLPYIAFEFIEGTNIRELVERRGGLPLAEAISYTLQIAEALAYAACQNVVHRDIKPSNILITPDGRAKLIDMGLARMQSGAGSAGDLTASGVTLGTFDYISPEQARDPRNADVRSDIYSLGCTLFFMLAGRPPFPEGTVLQKLLQHQGDEPPDIRSFRPDLPEELSRVLRRMMAKAPRHRYQEPAKLIESLAWLAQHVGLRPAGPGHRLWITPVEPEASFLERHLPWMAPVGILVLVVVLLHFLWDQPGAGTDPGLTVARETKVLPRAEAHDVAAPAERA
ncbi:MAG: serine/threonine protein kinase, partial [Pirellulales bacterium]|nr:serine/threonine protein kinase [Pirellulales bacterium]